MKRRNFIRTMIAGMTAPSILPSTTVFGKNAPNNKINIGQIGCGRSFIKKTQGFPPRWNVVILPGRIAFPVRPHKL